MLIFALMILLFTSCVCQREIHKESKEINADSISVKADINTSLLHDSLSFTDKTVEVEKEVSTSEKDATSTIVETIEETESPDGSKTRVTNRVINLHITEVDSSEYIRSLEEDIAYERHKCDSLSNIIFEMEKNTYKEEDKTYDKETNEWTWFIAFVIGLVIGGVSMMVFCVGIIRDYGKEDKT